MILKSDLALQKVACLTGAQQFVVFSGIREREREREGVCLHDPARCLFPSGSEGVDEGQA